MHIVDARDRLLFRSALVRRGLSQRGIVDSLRVGRLHRLARGVYVVGALWEGWRIEERHLLEVLAVDARQRGGSVVFTHVSAAVVHGLPLVRVIPARVHVRGHTTDGRTRAGDPVVARHRIPTPVAETVEIDGVLCTSLAQTVADVLRSESRETGMAVACAAMRRVAAGEHTEQYDQDAAEEFRSRVSALLRPGSRGVRKAREVLAMVDGRVESPGEAVSLLYLRELGYDITVQIAVPSAHGTYVIDFDLGDAWGEFDGQVKYTDPTLRGERTAADVVLAEKEREDWIRGTTGRRIIRWGWAHLESVDALARRLRAFGVRP